MGYNILDLLQVVTCLVVIGIAIALIRDRWKANEPRRQDRATKARLNEVGVLEDEEQLDPREAAQRNLRFLGLPSANAGRHITNVPCFNPAQAGKWDDTLEVVTTARAMAYTRQGLDPVEMIELTGGYLLVACGGKILILMSHQLTMREERELEEQRKAAIERGDGVIERFSGHVWRISGAYGDNVTRKPGERKCSYIQVLSIHPRLGEPGLRSILPPNLLDGEEHDYHDMRARNEDTGEILYFFHSGGKWNCFIGRLLTEEEANQMQGI